MKIAYPNKESNKIKIEVKEVKVEKFFDRNLGAYAEITGTYRGEPFLAHVQGGRDEEGQFERVNCPDCWTSIHVGGKDADFIGSACDGKLYEILGYAKEQAEAVWEAVEKFLVEHLGGERYWNYNDPLDRFGHEAEIQKLEALLMGWIKPEKFDELRKKHEDRKEYLAALEQEMKDIDEMQRVGQEETNDFYR